MAFLILQMQKEVTVKDFKIPIARYNGIDLHCIVEPEYAKLKTKMEQLLK